jgi:protocatechuate 4,5-dioxygenase beta chain
MGKLVFAGAISHAPGATGWPEKADPQMKDNFYRAAAQLGQMIRDAKPDVIIGVANDHVSNFHVDNFPTFAVGLASEHVGPGDWFEPWLKVPKYRVKGHPEFAGLLYNGLTKQGVVTAIHRDNFVFDDNYSVPLTLAGLTTAGIPLVPVMMNCTVPPVMSSQEAYATGKKFAKVFAEQFPDDVRIAFLATGGMSHEPGGHKYFHIDEKFDRWVMDLLARFDHKTIIEEVTYEKMEEAGSGGTSELLAWFIVMAAAGECKCNVLCYEPIVEWRCGMGAVCWDLKTPLVHVRQGGAA